MRTILYAGVFLTFSGSWVAIGDEATGQLAAKLTKIRKKFEADEKELKKKLADAKDGEDRQQAAFLIKELNAFAASDAIDVAEEGKKSEAGLEAAVFAMKLLGQHKITGADMEKATDRKSVV